MSLKAPSDAGRPETPDRTGRSKHVNIDPAFRDSGAVLSGDVCSALMFMKIGTKFKLASDPGGCRSWVGSEPVWTGRVQIRVLGNTPLTVRPRMIFVKRKSAAANANKKHTKGRSHKGVEPRQVVQVRGRGRLRQGV